MYLDDATDFTSYYVFIFFVKQKTAYDMRISDWSSDVCSSDLLYAAPMGPLLTTISGMLQRLSGDRLDPEEARIRVIALFGQAFAFRVARTLALRMTGWSEISAPQADAIRFVILS